MLTVQFKEGVQLAVTEAVLEILNRIIPVYQFFGVPCTVTSGTDGKHNKNSKHYSGQALDFRIRDIKPDDLKALVQACKERCGKDFFVLLEKTHIHVQVPKVKV